MDTEILRRLGHVVASGVNDGREGSWELYAPTKNIVVSIARGHLDLAFSHGIERVRALLLPNPGTITVFHDWADAVTYDHDFRANNQRTASAIADRLNAVHVLTRKGMIAMGVSTVGLALSTKAGTLVTTIFEREPFEQQLRAALSS